MKGQGASSKPRGPCAEEVPALGAEGAVSWRSSGRGGWSKWPAVSDLWPESGILATEVSKAMQLLAMATSVTVGCDNRGRWFLWEEEGCWRS